MKQLKLFYFLLLGALALLASPANAQGYYVSVSGTLFNGTTTVPNYPLVYSVTGPNFSVFDSVFTDANGYYLIDSIFVPVAPATVWIGISMCNGSYLSDTLYVTPNQPVITGNNYNICPITACNAMFMTYPSAGGVFWLVPNMIDSTVYSYQWNFGDGTSSTQVAPHHTFPVAGPYGVCLTVTGNGCTGTYCYTVNSPGSGIATCDASFAVSYTGQNSIFVFALDSTHVYTSYQWSWGDGAVSSGASPYGSHSYAQPDTYSVCLTVFDNTLNCQASFCDLVVVYSVSNCQPTFTFQTSATPQVYFFGNGPANPPGTLFYYWDFGDSTYSNIQNPVHTFPVIGTYQVCLTTYTSNGCTGTICSAVTVTQATNCDASFYTIDSGLVQVFIPTNLGNNLVHVWNPGDGTAPVIGNPVFVHLYSNPGTYTVCHIVYDSLQFCSDSICQVITVGGQTSCTASISHTPIPNAPGQYLFTAQANPAQGPVSYLWNFGNGNTASGSSAVRAYATSGIYPVCLTITYQSGCVATTCDSVVVTIGGGNTLAGLVITDSLVAPVLDALVYLIAYDSTAGTLSLVDSQLLSFPLYYAFQNVSPGSYLIKAALLPTDPTYSAFMPTYFGDEMFWYDAQSVVFIGGYLVLPPINLIAGNNPGGPGFIGGLVSQGANKTDEPMGMVSVLLLDENYQPVASALTDANGEYNFSNLPYGTYHVYLDIVGKSGEHWTVVLDGNTASNTLVDFTVNNSGIVRATGTGIVKDLLSIGVRAYPNPFDQQITLEMENIESREIEVRLVNMSGQEVFSQSVSALSGQATLETGNLPAGVYLLYVKAGEQIGTMRMVRN